MSDTHVFQPTLLREYDIRGVVGETLFEADARAIGRSFGTRIIENGGTSVATGRDGRHSSPAMEQALERKYAEILGSEPESIRARKRLDPAGKH